MSGPGMSVSCPLSITAETPGYSGKYCFGLCKCFSGITHSLFKQYANQFNMFHSRFIKNISGKRMKHE